MSGYRSVDVPLAVRPRMGHLLAEFEQFLTLGGFFCTRVPKLPGGHITPWWLHISVNGEAPVKSQLKFGETDYASVNPTPHLWVQGKEPYIGKGHQLLRKFIEHLMRPATPRHLVAKAAFDGREYGSDYLSFDKRDVIIPLPTPLAHVGTDLLGWAYGKLTDNAVGWFPAVYAT
jgi:hypothetical protein